MRKAIDNLGTGAGDIKKLQGSGNEFRLRVGSLRCRFVRDAALRTITVLDVFHCSRGY
ncbi:MAG: hypothetical protein M3Z23_09230 [Acidobacteriota bacterium]|nr:hypothetical protein [Acidobacteriota bacterium]